MSETKAVSSCSGRARSSGRPALACELPEVCSSQNPGSPRLGACWQGEVLHSWAVQAGSFCVTGQAPVETSFVLLWAQMRWWFGPSADCLEQYTAGGSGARRGPWRGKGHRDAPFLVLCGGNGRPVWLRTAFQPGIRHLPDGLDLSMCRSLSHKETNKKLKIKTVGGGGK